MKSIIVFTLTFLLTALNLRAQLVIEHYNHPTPANETVTLETSANAGAATPATGANMSWNFSGNLDTITSTPYIYSPPTDPLFSTATRSYVRTLQFSFLRLYLKQYELNDTTGDALYGFSNDTLKGFDISFYSMHKGDSLIFPIQHHLTPGEYNIEYPATANSSWASNTKSEISFILNLLAYGYKYAPGKRVTQTIIKDTVVGWGSAIIPYHSGASQPYKVLMVKEKTTTLDSFYLNDSAVSPFLLRNLGLANPTISNTFTYTFYRAGYSAPLITFYTDSAFKKIQYETYDEDHLALNGIENTNNDFLAPGLHPNPVNSSSFTLEFYTPGYENGLVSISNSLGQIIQRQSLNLATGKATIQVGLPANMPNGLYFYTISGANGQARTGKFIVKR